MARHLRGTVVSFEVRSEVGQLRQVIVHRRAALHDLPRRTWRRL